MSEQIVSGVNLNSNLSSTGRQMVVEAVLALYKVKTLLAAMSDKDYKIIRARIKSFPMSPAEREIYQWPFLVASELAAQLNSAEQYEEKKNEPTTQKTKTTKRTRTTSVEGGSQAADTKAAR